MDLEGFFSHRGLPGGSVSQHKATEERRYRMELAVVVAIGVALAVIAVATILALNPSPRENLEEYGGLSASID